MTKIQMSKIDDIKKLRQETNLPLIQCQQAIEDADGDMERAMTILKKSASLVNEKRSGRAAKSGIISCYSHVGKIGVMVELASESDFVSRNEMFGDLAHNLCLQIAAMNPQNNKELFSQSYIKDETQTIGALFNQTANALGEKIELKRFIRWNL